jgi:hypothetical protein
VAFFKAPGDDECQRAAGIYECGKKKAPGITDEIQKQLTNDRSNPPAPAVIQNGTHLCLVLTSINFYRQVLHIRILKQKRDIVERVICRAMLMYYP